MKDIFLSRTPLRRVFCYLHNQLGIEATPGDTRRCDITNKSSSVVGHGGLPNLAACDPREPGDGPACDLESNISGTDVDMPLVHLVHWIAPGQALPCQKTPTDFDASFREVGTRLKNISDEESVKSVAKAVKFLRKHRCFSDTYFIQQLHCNVHGCFGEGFTQRLKAVEDMLLQGSSYVLQLWDGAMHMWAQCHNHQSSE